MLNDLVNMIIIFAFFLAAFGIGFICIHYPELIVVLLLAATWMLAHYAPITERYTK